MRWLWGGFDMAEIFTSTAEAILCWVAIVFVALVSYVNGYIAAEKEAKEEHYLTD